AVRALRERRTARRFRRVAPLPPGRAGPRARAAAGDLAPGRHVIAAHRRRRGAARRDLGGASRQRARSRRDNLDGAGPGDARLLARAPPHLSVLGAAPLAADRWHVTPRPSDVSL